MNASQIQMAKDAIARWEGYRDRGIEPNKGWGSGEGGGGSCALGDIAFYSKIDTSREAQMRAAQREIGGSAAAFAGLAPEIPVMHALGLHRDEARALVRVNDGHYTARRWPIEELRHIVARAEGREVRRPVKLEPMPMVGLIEFIEAHPPKLDAGKPQYDTSDHFVPFKWNPAPFALTGLAA